MDVRLESSVQGLHLAGDSRMGLWPAWGKETEEELPRAGWDSVVSMVGVFQRPSKILLDMKGMVLRECNLLVVRIGTI